MAKAIDVSPRATLEAELSKWEGWYLGRKKSADSALMFYARMTRLVGKAERKIAKLKAELAALEAR